MTEIVLATGNMKKVREMRALLADLAVTLVGKDDVPGFPDVVEDGLTFKANALKKAREICAHTGKAALADDSGLEVDALAGAPGVYSARYAGKDATDADNNALLLKNLKDTPDEERGARFRCVIAVVFPDGRELLADEHCGGRILREARGEDGFGYDPLFYYEPFGKTFAEVSLDRKNGVSHRGRALRAMKELLENEV